MNDKKGIQPKEKQKINLNIIIITMILTITLFACSLIGAVYAAENNIINFNSKLNKFQNNKTIEIKTLSIGEFIVKLSDESTHYAKAKISVGIEKNSKFEKELESKEPILKDVINIYLMNKKYEDFKESNIENIKKELVERINKTIPSANIQYIYFEELITQ